MSHHDKPYRSEEISPVVWKYFHLLRLEQDAHTFAALLVPPSHLNLNTSGLEGPARSFGGDGVQKKFKTNPCTACGSPLPTTTNPLDVGLVVLCFQRAKLKMFILLLLLQAPAQSLGVQENLKTNPSAGCGSPLPTIPHPGLSHNLPFYVDDPIQATMQNIYHIGTGVRCN